MFSVCVLECLWLKSNPLMAITLSFFPANFFVLDFKARVRFAGRLFVYLIVASLNELSSGY